MKTEYFLMGFYIFLGCLNTYCFLFQRTARKIRQFAFGTQNIKMQNKFLPQWYFWLFYISLLMYIPMIWLLFINWKYAIVIYIVLWILKLALPVNDYSHVQKIKKEFEKRIGNNSASNEDLQLYNIILEVEKKTV
jgi:hypothetical protein